MWRQFVDSGIAKIGYALDRAKLIRNAAAFSSQFRAMTWNTFCLHCGSVTFYPFGGNIVWSHLALFASALPVRSLWVLKNAVSECVALAHSSAALAFTISADMTMARSNPVEYTLILHSFAVQLSQFRTGMRKAFASFEESGGVIAYDLTCAKHWA